MSTADITAFDHRNMFCIATAIIMATLISSTVLLDLSAIPFCWGRRDGAGWHRVLILIDPMFKLIAMKFVTHEFTNSCI